MPVTERITRSGYRNPDYKREIAEGKDATTVYNRKHLQTILGTLWRFRCRIGYRCNSYQANNIIFEGTPRLVVPAIIHSTLPKSGSNLYHASYLTSADYISADIRARERYYANLRDAEMRSQALVPVAEFRDLGRTVSTIADDAKLLGNMLLLARRKKFKRDPKGWMQFCADNWLTWSFGIKPMMSDAERIAQTIAAIKYGSPPSNWVKGKAKAESVTQLGKLMTFGDLNYCARNLHCEQVKKTRVRYAVKYTPSWFAPKEGVDKADLLGFNLRELPSTVWELTSYSWLIDYFTNVQKVLDSLAMLQIHDTPRFKITIGEHIRRYYDGGAYAWAASSELIDEIDVALVTREFNRSKIDEVPPVLFRIREIDEVLKNYDTKSLNVLACIANLIARR